MMLRQKMLWAVLLIFVAGCDDLTFKSPLTPDATAVTPYLGTWRLVKIGEEDDNHGTLVIVSGSSADDLKVTYKEAPGIGVTESLHLTSVSGTIIASVGGPDLWNVVTVSLQDGGTELTVRALDINRVKQDVEGSVLSGEIDDTGDGDTTTVVEASSAQLLAYLAANPSVLTSSSPGITLRKE